MLLRVVGLAKLTPTNDLTDDELLLRRATMRSSDLWDKNSLQWQKIGPPLRPCGQDIDFLQRLIAEKCAAAGCTSPRALLLGVTPEIARMRWPRNTRLLALDCHWGMIRNVWPGNRTVGAVAACGDWTKMPVADEACDVVVGDGCFSMLGYPEGYATVTRELRRVLQRDGLFAMRAFIRPDKPEPVAVVFDDLRAGRIGNFHVFKWRLNMALHGDLTAGVRLADSWNVWNQAVPEPVALAQKLDWPIETMRTIDAYRGDDTRYTYPTLAELRQALAAHFSPTACTHPAYELGERCPTLLFAPR